MTFVALLDAASSKDQPAQEHAVGIRLALNRQEIDESVESHAFDDVKREADTHFQLSLEQITLVLPLDMSLCPERPEEPRGEGVDLPHEEILIAMHEHEGSVGGLVR